MANDLHRHGPSVRQLDDVAFDAKHASLEDDSVSFGFQAKGSHGVLGAACARRRAASASARSSGNGAANERRRPSVGWSNSIRAACRNGRSRRATGASDARKPTAHATVERVAHDRVSALAEVHANLMRAPGANREPQQRQPAERFDRRRPSSGRSRLCRARLDIFRRSRGSRPIGWSMRAAGLDTAPHERGVLLHHRAVAKLPRQISMRPVVFRDDHHPRRAAVEPVHDARPFLSADAAESADVMQQRVHERAAAHGRLRDARPCPPACR